VLPDRPRSSGRRRARRSGRFMLMDLAGAQALLDRFGRVDYIDVRDSKRPESTSWRQPSPARLPEGLTVQRPARREKQVERCWAPFIRT
jgi:hypothetical protein